MNHDIVIPFELAEQWDATQVLRWAFETYDREIALASGGGPEGIVLIDLAARARPDLRVFTLDTDFLFQETYDLLDRIEARYGMTIERVRPALTPEQQAREHGDSLWRSAPDRCCEIRKVEPLRQTLAGLRAWATAIRRDQTPARANAGKIEWDKQFNLVKINPLADWTSDQVWDHIHRNGLPYNPLHDQGYPSIGCTHCTRAVQPEENERAGRWAGLAKTECGLHIQQSHTSGEKCGGQGRS